MRREDLQDGVVRVQEQEGVSGLVPLQEPRQGDEGLGREGETQPDEVPLFVFQRVFD